MSYRKTREIWRGSLRVVVDSESSGWQMLRIIEPGHEVGKSCVRFVVEALSHDALGKDSWSEIHDPNSIALALTALYERKVRP